MAFVVCLTTVITEELHGIVLGDVLGEVLCEVLGRVPKGGDRLDVLVQAESEAVLFLVVGHELEGVIVDIAVQLDAGLDTPVPLVVEHQWVTEEEAGFVAAHVPVADGLTVDDLLLLHLLTNLGSLLLVNPFGKGPVLLGDLAVLCLARHERRCDLFELIVEIIIIEEDPVVVELAVEAVFDLADRLGNIPYVRVASKRYEGSVHTVSISGRRGERVLVGCGLGRGLKGRLCLIIYDSRISGGWSSGVLVDGPARGRHRRRGADEVEEGDGLYRVNGRVCRCCTGTTVPIPKRRCSGGSVDYQPYWIGPYGGLAGFARFL